MIIRKNIPYYLIAIGIFILLKIGYTFADNDDLIFLLNPTDTLVGVITNSNSYYLAESGFFNSRLNIIIDKSCSGFNFWILCFIALTFLAIKNLDKIHHKIIALPTILALSYIFTILVNSSRILVSTVIHSSELTFIGSSPSWLHQAEGSFIYLSFLIVIYLGFEYLLKKGTKHYAKFT